MENFPLVAAVAFERKARDAIAGRHVAWMVGGCITRIELPEESDNLDLTLALAAARTPTRDLLWTRDMKDLIMSDLAKVDVNTSRDRLVLTRRGWVVWDARGRPAYDDATQTLVRHNATPPHVAHSLIACGGLHERTRDVDQPADPRRVCSWCRGVAWEGDLDDPIPVRPLASATPDAAPPHP